MNNCQICLYRMCPFVWRMRYESANFRRCAGQMHYINLAGWKYEWGEKKIFSQIDRWNYRGKEHVFLAGLCKPNTDGGWEFWPAISSEHTPLVVRNFVIPTSNPTSDESREETKSQHREQWWPLTIKMHPRARKWIRVFPRIETNVFRDTVYFNEGRGGGVLMSEGKARKHQMEHSHGKCRTTKRKRDDVKLIP